MKCCIELVRIGNNKMWDLEVGIHYDYDEYLGTKYLVIVLLILGIYFKWK